MHLFKTSLLITFALLAQIVFAQESEFSFDPKTNAVIPNFIGKVLLQKGEAVAISDGGTEKELKIGDKVFNNDTVKTTSGSFLKIEMIDTSLITLGPDTSMKFDEFKYRSKEDRESIYHLIKGQMRTQFKVKAKKEEAIKVKTGMISMGVRGTEFVVNNRDLESGENISEVLLIEGKIRLYDKQAKKEYQMKPKEHYISVIGERPFGLPNYIFEKMENETFEKIKGPELDPRRHFSPLLSFYDLPKVVVIEDDKKPGGAGKRSRGPASIEVDEEEDYLPTRSWKSTLDELNNRLKEND